MKQNTLRENMRRFGTKNLDEQVGFNQVNEQLQKLISTAIELVDGVANGYKAFDPAFEEVRSHLIEALESIPQE